MTSERAAKVTFPMDGKDVYVTEFFRTKHNRIIKYQNYPCLIVGNNGYVPLEVCKIVDCQPARGKLDQEKEQDKMVKATAIPPKARFDEIKNAILDVCNENREVLREFDMSISTDPKKLEGRVLAAPHVLYGNEDKANVRDGQWEMRGKSFVKGTSIEQWAMLSLCGCSRQDMKKFALELYKSGRNSGVNFYEPVLTIAEDLNSYTQIEEHLTRIKNENPNLQMALVVIKPNSPSYKDVKKISETDLGLITQCVTDINLKKCIENPHGGNKFGFRFFMNLCQKINAKMGGTNTSLTKEEKPTIFKKPIMIVGADVTHPRSDDRDKFSIAAVVGSIDSYPSRYCAAVELQRSETENRAREETIVKLEVMIKKLLKKFLECTNGHFPEKIIYYRDGVSEGQFLPVRDYELVQIRNACESFQNAKFRPEITFIVVQKRHHTKFKPEDFRDGAGKFGNVPAGTTVDTEITQPGHFNFYLCSHVAIQGTSRPGHYNVLYDDSDFTADDLQKLTFYLCHTYTRCTKSISIPPPVMYADLVAYRAKLYVDSVVERRNHSASSQSSDSRDVFLSDEIVNSIILKDAIKDSMYYV